MTSPNSISGSGQRGTTYVPKKGAELLRNRALSLPPTFDDPEIGQQNLSVPAGSKQGAKLSYSVGSLRKWLFLAGAGITGLSICNFQNLVSMLSKTLPPLNASQQEIVANPFTASSCAGYQPQYDDTLSFNVEEWEPLNATEPGELPYPPPPCQSHWPRHIEVYGSSSQNHFSYATLGNLTQGREPKSYYSEALRECITSNQTDSPGQCHADMRSWDTNGWHGRGYSHAGQLQFPTSSTDAMNGWCLRAWDKKDLTKKRFALLVSGEHVSDDQEPQKKYRKQHGKHGNDATVFDYDCQKWKQMLTEQYPNTTILEYPNGSSREIEKGLQKLQRQIQKATRGRNQFSKDDIEVLVYYVGHGQAFQSKESQVNGREGSAIGTWELRDGVYSEASLKYNLNRHLPGIATSVFSNCCQAGAFV